MVTAVWTPEMDEELENLRQDLEIRVASYLSQPSPRARRHMVERLREIGALRRVRDLHRETINRQAVEALAAARKPYRDN